MRILQKSLSWVEERFDLSGLKTFIAHKDVPVHKHSMWYFLGGVTLFAFLIQAGTGILLLLYYHPNIEEAYESVRYIMTDVHFGWLIRSMHAWGATLFVGSLVVHMLSTFFLKSYRKPRELTWVTGFFLLLLSMGMGFSGYLLPWDELAFFATKVGTEIAGVLPFVGEFLLKLLRGGMEISGDTLPRFYAFHVVIIPSILIAVMFLHVYFIQKQGMSVPPGYDDKVKERVPFFTAFILHDAIFWLALLGIWVFLVTYFPAELGPKADPFQPAPAGIHPEWYFMFMFYTLKLFPAKILFLDGELVAVLAFGLFFLLILLVPFLDRSADKKFFNKTSLIGIFSLIFILITTILGYMS